MRPRLETAAGASFLFARLYSACSACCWARVGDVSEQGRRGGGTVEGVGLWCIFTTCYLFPSPFGVGES